MKIKEILKKYKITLNELALYLELSRPTLNNYIKQFEERGKIVNEKYQNFFENLANKNYSNREEVFDEIRKWELKVKNAKEIKNNEIIEENMEILESIYKKIFKDMRGKKEVIPLYKFINSAIYNYSKDFPLTAYINYNLYLNGLKDIKKIKGKEKKLVSNLFPIMRSYVDSNLVFNEEGYESFLNRILEIKKNREKQREKIEEEIKKKLRNEFGKKIDLGKEITDEDIKDILNKIIF